MMWAAALGYLTLEFFFPHVYRYNYVTVERKGTAKDCWTDREGVKYCRINIKESIVVKDYEAEYGRVFWGLGS